MTEFLRPQIRLPGGRLLRIDVTPEQWAAIGELAEARGCSASTWCARVAAACPAGSGPARHLLRSISTATQQRRHTRGILNVQLR